VRLLTTDADGLEPARLAVQRELAEIDLAASRFRDDSEVSRLASAAGRTMSISPLLAAALAAALRAARLTGGAVDPTVGGTLVDLGYDRDYAQLRPDAGRLIVRQLPGWQSVELDVEASTVRVPPGTVIDLGATAKAFAADRAAERAAADSGCGVLVSLGGDIAVAGPVPDGGWQVLVTDDHASTLGGQLITILSGGLATSSTTVRRWRSGGRELHHLLDPATCAPVDGPWRTVSVAAGRCLDANVASTATIVLGDHGLSWLGSTGLPGRLIARDGTVHYVGGWPRED
jgi:thiamine biosynthesis lipoprotein